MKHQVHIPYLSEDEKIFLNTTAIYSQARRVSSGGGNHNNSIETAPPKPSMEDNNNRHSNRRYQVVSASSLSFLWKRRGSSSSSLASSASSNGSIDFLDLPDEQTSAKAKELESLIFEQPQRTVRLSLTPRCAV